MNENSEKEGHFLLASGPKTLAEWNPKGVLRFADRHCATCDKPIMGHYIRPNDDPDLRSEYWCSIDGDQYSAGLKE